MCIKSVNVCQCVSSMIFRYYKYIIDITRFYYGFGHTFCFSYNLVQFKCID